MTNAYDFLVQYATVAEYRKHFLDRYVASYVETFDEIPVLFEPHDFDHAFYEGMSKNRFSWDRAERIDWIASVLQDPHVTPRCGWDSGRWRHDWKRRVSVLNDYVVVVELLPSGDLRFVTAYIAERNTSRRLRRDPKWRW
jgi:hypothetical protein